MNFGDIKLVLRSFQGLIPGKSMRRCVIIVLILNESFVAQKWNLARNKGRRTPRKAPVGRAGALIEWAWALRYLPMSETPAKIDFSTQKMGFVFANEF